MSKITKLGFLLLVGASGIAQALPSVYWGHSGNSVLVNYGATSGTTANRLVVGSIVQLIKSSDALIDAINMADPFNPSIAGGNDTLVLQSTIGTHTTPAYATAGRFYYGAVDGSTTAIPFSATDHLYLRVFQATSTTATPGSTIYYAQGSAYLVDTLGVLPSNDPLVIPPFVDIWKPDTTGSVAFLALDRSVTIIPEPVSAGFGLAGLALLAWRRRRLAQG